MEKIIAVIPARYQSSRFPGKPLAKILGKPMIQWVYERVKKARGISGVFVATDDMRIYNAVTDFGGSAVMTGECSCGTDRVFQAVEKIQCDIQWDIVVNVQGDEPTINPIEVEELMSAFSEEDVYMATLKKKIDSKDSLHNTNIVKVVTDYKGDAMYFSRSMIPYNRDTFQNCAYYRHVGIYAYKKAFLKEFVKLPESSLETAEKLEQLRVLENGYKIRVLETQCESIGVDTKEDLALAESILKFEETLDLTMHKNGLPL